MASGGHGVSSPGREWRRPAAWSRWISILAKGISQEGFGDAPESPNATPHETIWVRAVSTPCRETRIVVDRDGQRSMTTPTPREIRALARDGSTLYAITSAPAPCSEPSDVTLVRLSPPVFTPAG